MHIAGAIYRSHSAKPYHLLNGITLAKYCTCLELALGGTGILIALIII